MRCVASANKNTATSLVQDFQFSSFLQKAEAVNSTGDKAQLFLPLRRGKEVAQEAHGISAML